MATIGFHASHEQFSPDELLRHVVLAEKAGFQAAMCSDHFFPWSAVQGNSGFAWAWLGAAMQATRMSFGTVCAPGQRYNPAIVAQASATLAQMYPDRFWVALGSGQFLNEHITGEPWPTKADRHARLEEAVDVIRALWAGDEVTHYGHFTVEEAMLYTRPEKPPLIMGAATTPETARWVAGWADALITISKPIDEMVEVVEAFREGGGSGKPMLLQVQLSYAPSHDEALDAAHREWGTNVLESPLLTDLKMPKHFEAIAEHVTKEEVEKLVLVSPDTAQHTEWLQEYLSLGFDTLYLHNIHRDQERFIEAFGEKVLPNLTAEVSHS
jgi:coenzyme F420-dependent glucose-6-phosphate dehydrogenase